MKKFISLSLSLVLAVSCASQSEKNTKNPFDPLTLKENLLLGKTTQAQLMETFGAPDMVTEDGSKEDIWAYNQRKSESSNSGISSGMLAFLPIAPLAAFDIGGSLGKRESGTKSTTLMLYFDKKKVLKNYNLQKVKI
jgi:outer membrane protein assembly factor BamE (lipoprotein component of BamABCDE complex)